MTITANPLSRKEESLDLTPYSIENTERPIYLQKEGDTELETLLATSMRRDLDRWEQRDSHMKDKHGDYGKEALQIMHAQLTSPEKPAYSPILSIEQGEDGRVSAVVSIKKAYCRTTEVPFFVGLASYLKHFGGSKTGVLKSFERGNDFQNKLSLCITAGMLKLNPFELIQFYGNEAIAAKIFLQALFENNELQKRPDEVDYVQIVEKTARKTGIGDVSKVTSLITLPWEVIPKICFAYNPVTNEIENYIVTAFLRFVGVKRIPLPKMRGAIYSSKEII